MIAGLLALAVTLAPHAALAAEEGIAGAQMSLLWGVPFAGILVAIATGPLFYAHTWEHHYGKFALFFALCVVIPLYIASGSSPTAVTHALAHTWLLEYMPFILLLLALFTSAGGIYLDGNLRGTPLTNSVLLLIGAVLASFVGTTGASMIMIRPLIRANDDRIYRVHTVVFFIFLVSNIGGALTPLGDPPLFVGFLKGVDFFWTTKHLLSETLFVGAIVLAVFFAVDTILHRRETHKKHPSDPTPDSPLRLHGLVNFGLIGVIIAAILMSAWWKPGIALTIAAVEVPLQDIARDATFVAVAFLSIRLTRAYCREANAFSWGPILEVGFLFAAIFTCLVPVVAILKAGQSGALAPLLALVSGPGGQPNNVAYFWLSGALSSFLDNAPTYLVFFELAGGDPNTLMTTLGETLAAISTGAVFMGANTYVGNAPNFMVYAIARQMGVPMPSFFGYMLWSGAVLIPTFLLCTWVFFM
jgi:Na+/H+ antiporter NhaD/arsenite permease-like protein